MCSGGGVVPTACVCIWSLSELEWIDDVAFLSVLDHWPSCGGATPEGCVGICMIQIWCICVCKRILFKKKGKMVKPVIQPIRAAPHSQLVVEG